jgi:hypothetical protein
MGHIQVEAQGAIIIKSPGPRISEAKMGKSNSEYIWNMLYIENIASRYYRP